MSDSIQTYGVDKLDELVKEAVVSPEEKLDIPEELQTQLAEEIEPEVDLERDLDVLQRLDPNFINDPVRLYLREIAETPLLTHAQEIELAKRVEDGDHGGDAALRARQPAPGGFDRQALCQSRSDAARPDSGRQHRPDARRAEVRLAQGFPLQHVRHLVDSPGDHPRHRRSEPHHSAPGSHGRFDLPLSQDPEHARPGARPPANPGRGCRGDGRCSREDSADHPGRAAHDFARDADRQRGRDQPRRSDRRRGFRDAVRGGQRERC